MFMQTLTKFCKCVSKVPNTEAEMCPKHQHGGFKAQLSIKLVEFIESKHFHGSVIHSDITIIKENHFLLDFAAV